MSEAALFYPKMHIDNVEWLKGSLLLFDEVRRMVPRDLHIEDSFGVRPFTQPHGGKKILLGPAPIRSPRTQAALLDLANKIEKDAQSDDFRGRFGENRTRASIPAGADGYQIHIGKFFYPLIETLRQHKLCWKPRHAEPYSYADGYIEVNPRLGEAIMSTLAISCAKSAGLKIITDGRRLHECLARLDGQHVYEGWVKGDDALPEPSSPSGAELLECLVTIACDTTELTPQILADMKKEREPLRKLLAALDVQAKEIAPMDDGAERKKKMRDEVAKILAAWEKESRNLSPFFKRFFGLGLLDPGAKFADKVATGLSNVATSGSAGGTASLMLGAEYGLAIGFITHAVKSFADTRAGKQSSPYTLLTTLQREGVVIRSSADVKRGVNAPDPEDQRDIADYDSAF